MKRQWSAAVLVSGDDHDHDHDHDHDAEIIVATLLRPEIAANVGVGGK